MAFIGRIVVIVFAFGIANLAGAVAETLHMLVPTISKVGEMGFLTSKFSIVLSGTFFMLSFVALLLPAIIGIALAEAFALRSVFLYAVGGALAYLFLFAGGFSAPRPPNQRFEMDAAAGIVAGLVYWILAGRNAGRWRERAPSVSR